MKLLHNVSNSNSTFPLSGSGLVIDECADTLGRPPTREPGGIGRCGGVIPLTLASRIALEGCEDKMSWSDIFGIDGGVSKPGSGALTARDTLRAWVLEAAPGFKCWGAGPNRAVWL